MSHATSTGWPALDLLLQTDPGDAGCRQAMRILHVYAELVADTPAAALELYPGVAAHVRACGPCAEDLEGLLSALRP